MMSDFIEDVGHIEELYGCTIMNLLDLDNQTNNESVKIIEHLKIYFEGFGELDKNQLIHINKVMEKHDYHFDRILFDSKQTYEYDGIGRECYVILNYVKK
jgi:hypothetical protein